MQKVRIAVLVSGGGTNLQALIDEIEKGGINGEIVLVMSDREGAYALTRAQKHGIKAVTVCRKSYNDREAFNNAMLQELREVNAEFIVLGGFLSIFTSSFVKEYEGRIINVHPALIPAFCGNGFYGDRVHKAVIEYGVKVSGATVHFVDEGTDSGPIILQEVIAVAEDDTYESLAAKVLKLEHKLLPEAVKLYCDGKLRIEGRKVRIR
ncbi:MAG: phosphoribosylglycinamide formyltransferase [Bacillota bacterium]